MAIVEPRYELSFDQYLKQCPEDEGHYELINGELVRFLVNRYHTDVADYIAESFVQEIDRHQMNYKVSGRIAIATTTPQGQEQGRFPDVCVVPLDIWRANRSADTAMRDGYIQLIVEVTSTNWEDDYIDKLDEYQRRGVFEYWIADYNAQGSRQLLGNPKEPSVFVYILDETGQYQVQRFQGSDRIISPTFPGLELTVAQILEA
jgi:Uma2 family endonuclease